MTRILEQKGGILGKRGPGKSPAPLGFVVCLVELFLFTQSALAVGLQGLNIYSQPSSTRDDARGAGDSRFFDSKRAVERFQQRSTQEKENRKRNVERQRDAQQAQEVERDVVQEQRVSQATSQQQKREADSIYERTTGVDRYSVGKDGSVWWSKLGVLYKAWNIPSYDIYGNKSLSELTNFIYNDFLNVTGMHRRTVDQAGRVTETEVYGITYQEGETPQNYLGENKEATRTEVTTVYHPTGNQVIKTEYFDFVYEEGKDGKVISQKARITDLSGPGNPVLQETFNMVYEDGKVVSSESRITDLVTGVVTESVTKNKFSGNYLISGVTESTIKDPIYHTITYQTFTQEISYNGDGRVTRVNVSGSATTQAMDETGNPVAADYIQTTETTQTMGNFFGVPEVIESVTVTKTLDRIEGQTIESTLTQKYVRDEHGNLLGVSGAETAMTVNADQSVIQTTESTLEFVVRMDQAYLVGREDHSLTKDLINDREITADSHFEIEVNDKGEILEGTRVTSTHATNSDGSIVTDSVTTEYYDRADDVNALGLVRRETHSKTVNKINVSLTSRDALDDYSPKRKWGRHKPIRTFEEIVTEEHQVYTQSHDSLNRVLGAEETVSSHTTTSLGRETIVEGKVTYAVGRRSNRPYAVLATNRIVSKDPIQHLYTESTQVTTFECDLDTGRAIRGKGITDSTSRRMLPDGRVVDDVVMILGHVEEDLVGLEDANGFGMTTRKTHTEIRDLLHHQVTDQDEIYTQSLNGVGKIESAQGLTRSITQDLDRMGVYQTMSLTKTDYRTILGNATVPIAARTVEVSVSHVDGSYREAARRDVTRYDDYGRILPINEENPDQSGYVIEVLYDVTVEPIPDEILTPDQLFERFFGSGIEP